MFVLKLALAWNPHSNALTLLVAELVGNIYYYLLLLFT